MGEKPEEWDPLDVVLRHHSVSPEAGSSDGEGDPYRWRARASVSMYGSGAGVVEHLAFLRVVGTPEEITARLRGLEEARRAVIQTLYNPEFGPRPPVAGLHQRYDPVEEATNAESALVELIEYTRELREEARSVVEGLERDGFVYVSDDDQLKVDTGGDGANPKAVREVIGRLHNRWREQGKDWGYDRDYTSKIRSALSAAFPAELLSHSRIKSVIQSREKG